MTRMIPSAMLTVACLSLFGCNGAEGPMGPQREQVQPPDQFVVHIADREATLPAALLKVHYYSDGRSEATLAFEAGTGDQAISLFVDGASALFEGRQLESPVRSQPGGATLMLGGQASSRGTLTARIVDAESLSGRIEGAEVPVSFSGHYVVSCSVGSEVLAEASGDTPPAVPVPSDGSTGEVLVSDVNFVSPPCSALKQQLNRQ